MKKVGLISNDNEQQDGEQQDEAIQEVQILSNLSHLNIIQLRNTLNTDNELTLIMDYAE